MPKKTKTDASAPAHRFTVYVDVASTCVSLVIQPCVQTFGKGVGVYAFVYTAECITIRYPVRQFQKSPQPFLAIFPKFLHIHKILAATYY